jgi:hypothetical protein
VVSALHRSYHFSSMSTSIARLIGALTLVCLATACNNPAPPGPDSSRTEPPSTSCPNEEELGSDGSVRKGGLKGDVTGDGEADDVFIAVDEEAEFGCRALLFVSSGERTSAVSLDVEGTNLGLGLPALSGIKQVDGDGGVDVIADIASGASTQFAGLFVFADGNLEQIQIEGSQPPVEDLFAHGGGVAQLSAVDCAGDDSVLVSTAVAKGRRYRVDRHTYEFDDGVLARNPTMDEIKRVKLRSVLSSFPEFAGPPFSSCPDA